LLIDRLIRNGMVYVVEEGVTSNTACLAFEILGSSDVPTVNGFSIRIFN